MRNGMFFKVELGAIQVEAVSCDGLNNTFIGYLDKGERVYGLGDDFDVQSADSVLTCQSRDAVCLDRGSTVQIGDATYVVERVLADGTGMSKVILSDGTIEAC